MSIQPVERGWKGDDSTFGARLALIRQRMQWGNVREAAIACGVPAESWRGWERDGRLPRDFVAISAAISAASGCDLAWLMGADRARELGPRQPVTRAKRRAESKCIPPRAHGSSTATESQPWTPVPGADPLRRTA